MNANLIRKLAIQTDAWCDQNISYPVNTAGYNSCWEQKFAELIVQKCANFIKNTDSDPDIGEEDAQALLDHFGIKE